MRKNGILFLSKKIVILTMLFITTSLFAVKQADIKNEMEYKVNTVLNILQNKELKKEQKVNNIFELMDSLFDYTVMSQISLGKNWKRISDEERKSFTLAFEKKLKNSFIEKLDLYNDQEMLISNTNQIKKNRIELLTQLVGPEENYPIIYKFYKQKKTDNWLIYDINIIGVSIIHTYRKQFIAFLREKPIEELISNLNSKSLKK